MNNDKKILVISNMYPSQKSPEFGIFVDRAVQDLISLGYEVHKAVRTVKGRGKLNKILSYLFFYIRSLFVLILKDYDYVYLHYVSHSSLPVIIACLFKRKIKVVSHVHGGDVKLLAGRNSFFFKIKEVISKSVLKRSYKIICPSKYYVDYVMSKYPFLAKDTLYIYPSGGVNDIFFNENIKEYRKNKIIGYAGRLVKSKNVDVIVSALNMVDNIELQIVGVGETLSELKLMAKSLPVTFFNPMNHTELAEWYRNIDILIYPSESESLGLVPLEAMACGTFTLLSDIPAFRELSDNGLKIQYLDSISREAIVKGIAEYSNLDDHEKEHLRIANINIIKKVYGSSNIKKELSNVFS